MVPGICYAKLIVKLFATNNTNDMLSCMQASVRL
jgi:hypothetical protein